MTFLHVYDKVLAVLPNAVSLILIEFINQTDMKINKITLSAIVLIALFGLFLAVSVAQAQEAVPNASGANGSEESAPSAVGANASEEGTPSGQGTNDSEGGAIIPNTGGTNDSEGGAIIPNGNGANNDEVGGTDDNVTPPTGDEDDENSNNGSGSRSNRGNSSPLAVTSVKPILITLGSCSYISDYLKLDGVNNAAEVTRLQTFLKNTEKLDVDINGIFDQKTFEAVKAFQAKYVDEIMLPWGVTTPTGQVFYTTKKKINEIYCKSTFSLTPDQIAQIEAYRKGIADGTIVVDADGTIINATGTIPLSPEVGTAGDSQTASVGGFGTKIWNFIKWLFGY